ncbi:MAG: ABC transporter permease [Eubacterium sp.]|nr:ABC transporter permease [Eubacterium sp.]
MFGRIVLARLKIATRSKIYLFWCLIFPLGLGTLFYFAFSSIYESSKSEPIPVVVQVNDSAINEYKVLQAFSSLDKDKLEENFVNYNTDKAMAEAMGEKFEEDPPMSEDDLDVLNEVEGFDDMVKVPLSIFDKKYLKEDPDKINSSDLPLVKVLDEVEYDDGTKIIKKVEAKDSSDAEELLKDGDISGIITINGLKDISLLVSEDGIDQSILSGILSEYLLQVDLTIDRINADPEDGEDMEDTFDSSSYSLDYVNSKTAAGENRDPFVTYFYNLLAMVALMGSIASMKAVVNTQANQTATGLRIDSSPVNKVILELADLTAITFVQVVIMVITVTYLLFGLNIKFGGDVGLIYLTALASSAVGTTLGYVVGHIGRFSDEIKEAMLMLVFLGGGFLSGLMYGDMKIIIEEKCPMFNRINPSAIISDAYMSLNLFGPGKMYHRSMISILVFVVVMLLIGVALSGRKSYKTL